MSRKHLDVAESLYALLITLVRDDVRDISLTAAATLGTLERTGPRRITELAASEGVAQPSMTALVTGLERAGMVERRRDPSDQRVVLVALTRSGRDYIRRRRRAGAERFAQLIDKLAPEERHLVAEAGAALAQLAALAAPDR